MEWFKGLQVPLSLWVDGSMYLSVIGFVILKNIQSSAVLWLHDWIEEYDNWINEYNKSWLPYSLSWHHDALKSLWLTDTVSCGNDYNIWKSNEQPSISDVEISFQAFCHNQQELKTTLCKLSKLLQTRKKGPNDTQLVAGIPSRYCWGFIKLSRSKPFIPRRTA